MVNAGKHIFTVICVCIRIQHKIPIQCRYKTLDAGSVAFIQMPSRDTLRR